MSTYATYSLTDTKRLLRGMAIQLPLMMIKRRETICIFILIVNLAGN